MSDDPVGRFLGGGAPSVKLERVGDFVEGAVVEFEEKQDEDMDTRKPKVWPNGDPVKVYVVTLQTNEQTNDDDDGLRRLWVRNRGIKALREAFREAGVKSFADMQGGTLKFGYTGDDKPRQRGQRGAKLYRARFTPLPAEQRREVAASRQPGDEDEIPF